MYKLLPPEHKAKVFGEYRLRRSIIFFWSLAVVVALGVAALYPSYASISARKAALVDRLGVLAALPATSGDNNLKAWAGELRQKLAVLAPSGDTDRPYDFLVSALAVAPKGVRLASLSWSKDGTKRLVALSGVADNREDLLAFEGALNALPDFKDSNFPISNLAQDANISFHFDLTPVLK